MAWQGNGERKTIPISCVIRIKKDSVQNILCASGVFSILLFFHFPSDFIAAARCVNEHRMHLCVLNYNIFWDRRVVYR